MTWFDIFKKKKWPTPAQKKNKNWNNLTDEERLQVRIKRDSKGRASKKKNEEKKLRTCPKCNFYNPYKAKYCVKCGTKLRE